MVIVCLNPKNEAISESIVLFIVRGVRTPFEGTAASLVLGEKTT